MRVEEPSSVPRLRVFVVEDSPLIADLLEDILLDLDCEIVGPTGNMATALQQARDDSFDVAFIDINIRGGKVFPVADILNSRDIPFIFVSGYAKWDIPDQHRSAPRLEKPFTKASVQKELSSIFSKSPDRQRTAKSAPFARD